MSLVLSADESVVVGETEFTEQDALMAGLIENTSYNMYKKYPRNMYLNRATANLVRTFCPEITNGVIYTPDELPDSELFEPPIRSEECVSAYKAAKMMMPADVGDELEGMYLSKEVADEQIMERISLWRTPRVREDDDTQS
jgi:hypothetical protein